MRNSTLTEVAEETVEIAKRGWYDHPATGRVWIGDAVSAATIGTRLYRPGAYSNLRLPSVPSAAPAAVEVTDETTAEAVRRLTEREGHSLVAALNFASAKNPGGGFLRGTKAQEEDLARCSALYACQVTQPDYYKENREAGSVLYTDHLIYSPAVPFFRDDHLELLPTPFAAAVLTSPAPNAREAREQGEGRPVQVARLVRATLERRAEQLLRVALHHGHRTLVLGAWGCGVFGNDPREVAQVFATLLAKPTFAFALAHVTFAVYDRTEAQTVYTAFHEQFAAE